MEWQVCLGEATEATMVGGSIQHYSTIILDYCWTIVGLLLDDLGISWQYFHLAVCQNLVPLVNIKIAGKWMFIPLKMVGIGIDPYHTHFTGPHWIAIQLLNTSGRAVHLLLKGIVWHRMASYGSTRTKGLKESNKPAVRC